MPKKVIQEEIYNPEPELEVEEKPIKISKRTGKPVRPMTEKQKENLTKGRQIAIEKKKELNAGGGFRKKSKNDQGSEKYKTARKNCTTKKNV